MTKFEDAKRVFFDYCKSKNLSEHTIGWYRYRLLEFERFMFLEDIDFANITIHDLRRMVGIMIKYKKPSTVNHTVTAVKTFYSWLLDEGYIEKNPAAKLQKIRTPKVLIEPLSQGDLERLVGVLDKSTFVGLRDYTLILLSLDTGMRVNEILNIKLSDLEMAQRQVKVMGKGSRERIVPIGATVLNLLRRHYLPKRGDLDTDFLFVSEYGDKLSKRTYQGNLKRYARMAGISDKRVSPHTFRHSWAIAWLRNGGDVFSLQAIGGWSSLEIAKRYINLARDDIHNAMAVHSPADAMFGGATPGTARHKGKKKIR